MANSAADIQKLYIAYFNRPADPLGLQYWTAQNVTLKSIAENFALSTEYKAAYDGKSTAQVVGAIYQNLFGHTADPAGLTYWAGQINNGTVSLGSAALSILGGATGADLTAVNSKVTASTAFTTNVDTTAEITAYSSATPTQAGIAKTWLSGVKDATTLTAAQATIDATIAAITTPVIAVAKGTSFALATETAAGAKVMHITGDQAVRIDFTNTNTTSQIKGLDLNGNGVIENNGVENNSPVAATGYVIVDAYARNKLVDNDVSKNYLGDIAFDGTGFQGDGTKTNGNIFLGGLGVDTAFGGIGNDFLAGGGVAPGRFVSELAGGSFITRDTLTGNAVSSASSDALYGGRNADFFFVELSALDATDGSRLFIDGGSTSDDLAIGNNSRQDSDWLLLEASDDDETVTINLNRNTDLLGGVSNNNIGEVNQVLRTDSGKFVRLNEIENVDASGNLFGFVDALNTTLGARNIPRAAGTPNDGIGSTAQLNITGSVANNILIGGYDNDFIDGGAGSDLIFGGNLRKLINPNVLLIPNDGIDTLIGGDGSDNIVFEADGGIVEGGKNQNVDDSSNDTLWLSDKSLGSVAAAATVTTDGVLRFDLLVGKSGGLDNASGYGGADKNANGAATGYTADQTNYKAPITTRTQVQDIDNVIATGLGAIDFNATGANVANDLTFNNQQNFGGYKGDLTLRGTNGNNTLYANTGNDILEGRAGNDLLSGGDGNDDFVFFLQNNTGDGVDIIHRQADLNNDGLWDGYSSVTLSGGTFVQDFGVNATVLNGPSSLVVDFGTTDLSSADVDLATFSIKIGGVTFAVADTTSLKAATTIAQVATIVNNAFKTQDANVTAVVSGSKVIVTDAAPTGGRAISATVADGYGVTFAVSNGQAQANASFLPPGATVTQDRLIYRSYEDRADGELVNDDATHGSIISLGRDAYAQDLVISFGADGTRIAEDQGYTVKFLNLTTQDKVSININGVTYDLQVGVDLDGRIVNNEDSASGVFNQITIQQNFVARLNSFINTYLDNDTSSGQIGSSLNAAIPGVSGGDTLTLTQVAYNGEETVFVKSPAVTLTNVSGGEPPSVTVTNVSQHEVFLLGFDGRNNNLNATNVLFVGDTNIQRSILETTKSGAGTTQTLVGKDAVLVDIGADDLAGITLNPLSNGPLAAIGLDFSVHGDDFLIGSTGNDTISGGTGDDRIVGSLGTDILDGGKNYYAVQVLGETEKRVFTWNVWEAANPTIAAPALSGLVLSSVTLIAQTEDGNVLKSGLFDDTLIYQQADFDAVNTRFTITLNNFNVNGGGVLELRNGGAGTVSVDVNGNGIVDGADATSTFTNFENIRTVAGTGKAVAGAGQGNDTLNVVALSTATGGISYDLTNIIANQGKVNYSVDAHANLAKPAASDFESLVIRVDGVENVISGDGDDLVLIDQTEAAKNNSFSAGLGDDRIIYSNSYGVGLGAIAEPTITIKVETSSDVDQIISTGGRVGSTVATDTLTSVEFISLTADTASSGRENDVLDVTSQSGGSVTSYVDGTVKTLSGTTLLTIDGIAQIENVIAAGGDDTVIVAGSAIMGSNLRSDNFNAAEILATTPSKDLAFSTFLDFDELNGSNARIPFISLAGGPLTGPGQIENAINQNEFTFSLGAGNDTVDYSNVTDAISVVVELDVTKANQYVLVDANPVAGKFTDVAGTVGPVRTVGVNDRVDVLTNVERVVASQNDSVLDLTSSNKGLEVKFQAYDASKLVASLDRDVYGVQISDLSSSVPLTRNYVEYRDAGLLAPTAALPDQAKAVWTRVEGSDFAERIILNSQHSFDNDTFNLRGGANEVKYNELTKSITLTLSVSDFLASAPLTTGRITGVVTFQDGTGAGVVGPTLAGSGSHVITSYTANNGIAAGSLRIAASQDAEDNLALTGLGAKVFLIAQTGTTDNQITVKLGSGTATNSVVLTGFELVSDAGSDDIYDFGSLITAASGLDFIDNVLDHDTVKVGNDAVNFGTPAPGAGVISLASINGSLALSPTGFDFDVLDVTGVTDTTVTSVVGVVPTLLVEGSAAGVPLAFSGTTDEVVFGKINNIVSALQFESVVLTDATIAEDGTTYTLNATANTLVAGAKTVALTNLSNTLSFGGLVLEQAANPSLRDEGTLNVTSGVTVNVVDTAAEGVNITGGNGADTLIGSNGNDVLRGGKGNDILDGSFVASKNEVHTYTFSNPAVAGSSITIDGFTVTGGAVVQGVIVANVDADAYGAAFVREWLANPASFTTVNNLSAAPNTLSSVAYDALTNVLSFTFANGLDPANNVIGAAGGTAAASVSAETLTQAYTARAESSDTYVFEKTAALNGVDTINNFNAANALTDDLLNFRAFFGAAPTVVNTTFATWGSTNLNLSAANVGVLVNKATLTASDVGTVIGSAFKVTLLDNAKAVILVTGDVDGVSDATNDGYKAYYVEDTDAGVGQTWVVTLIANINSGVELNASALLLGTSSFI